MDNPVTIGDWLPGLLFAVIMSILVLSLLLGTGKVVYRRLQNRKTNVVATPIRRRRPYYSKDKF